MMRGTQNQAHNKNYIRIKSEYVWKSQINIV
jgi:hypothetical protein